MEQIQTRPTLNVFVSCERVDDERATAFIEALRRRGCVVSHSPRNPMDGQDERWADWYAVGLKDELRRADVFVAVVTSGWASSSWMLCEAVEARQQSLQRSRRMFQYNVLCSPVFFDGKPRGHEQTLLPLDIEAAAEILLRNSD